MRRIIRYIIFLVVAWCSAGLCRAVNSISLSTHNITVSGSSPNYSVNVGSINGLGLGTPASNVNVFALGGGQLYWITIGITLGFQASGNGTLSIEVTTNYTHSSVQTAYFCNAGACNAVTPTAITTSYTVWASSLSNGSYLANLGTLLQPTNGAGAFTGADSVTLTLQTSSTGSPATCNLTINLSAQNAVQFTLATSGAPD